MMKFALCTHKYVTPFVGGVDVYTDRLRVALQKQGHEVVVLAYQAGGDQPDFTCTEDTYDDTKVWRIRYGQRPKSTFDNMYDPDVGQVTLEILETERPDVLIVVNFYTITFAVVEAAKTLGIIVGHIATDFLPVCRRATFIRWHGRSCEVGESVKTCAQCFVSGNPFGRITAAVLNHFPEKTLLHWAEGRDSYSRFHPLYPIKPYLNQLAIISERLQVLPPWRQQVDFVLPPTRFTLNKFAENGYNQQQLHLAPFGVEADNALSQLSRTPSEKVRFLFIGRFQPYKGTHIMLEAFNHLVDPQAATLTIYGTADNDYLPYFHKLEKMMAANDRVHFAGRIAPTELARAFSEADVFILPSTWHENMPLILLDALQSRTPVIASNIGGVTDVLKHEANGLLFDMGNVTALRTAMQRVIDDSDLLNRLRQGIDLPSIDEYATAVIALCQQHLQKSG